jgi:hypothetical protein
MHADIMTTYVELANSSFLDYASWRTNADAPSGGTPLSTFSINVALVLDRANDPTDLLASNWATRQAALADQATIWSTYGADPVAYDNVVNHLATLGIPTFYTPGAPADGQYVSSPESRTIWITLDEHNFTTLFGPGATLMTVDVPAPSPGTGTVTVRYWNGNLSLPSELADNGVTGLWFDSGDFGQYPDYDPPPTTGVTLPQGWQSPGNSAGSASVDANPQSIAQDYYNFPLTGSLWDPTSPDAVMTGAIGLVEPGVGTALPGDPTGSGFQAAIDAYRTSIGISTSANVISVAGGGQEYPTPSSPTAFNPAGERSLDVGVVTAINPQSTLVVYAGSGTANGAHGNGFTAYQSAFWDTINNPAVITSSFNYASLSAPGSPFLIASNGLYVDAALRNISVFNDAGDGGSGETFGNGLPNASSTHNSPYAVIVGGTSISTGSAAQGDSTLSDLVADANAGDLPTLWQLIAGGLAQMPAAGDANRLVETVWNRYYVDGTAIANPRGTGYIHNNTGASGVDTGQPAPAYQVDYGLAPITSDPTHQPGRGIPDVSANAGGNMLYVVPNAEMTANQNDDGTSAATPLWATLASQINAIFTDQGLPNLGYMNDLLYTAGVIAPASFSDISIGNSTSSFLYGGSYTSDGVDITPTGYGYSAGTGYDLVTGLGTPNGVLLARALTGIAHSQVYFGGLPDLIDSNGAGGWTSGTAQTLLLQTSATASATVAVHTGSDTTDASSTAHGPYAWTSQLAQQSLQSDFDGDLLALFDGQGQGNLAQAIVANGDTVSVTFNGGGTVAAQANLSSSSGFADFFSDAGNSLRLAQAVAVAETANGADDVNVVVRMRQVAGADLSLMLYKVDDYNGTIGGLAPDQAGYAAAAAGRAYAVMGGGTTIAGPGDGNAGQAQITGVDAGDLIAMQLTNVTNGDTFWAFSQANEMVGGEHVAHLWNYGANTWGWEDLAGGGDRDFNDLVVQLDFTSTAGHGWLV